MLPVHILNFTTLRSSSRSDLITITPLFEDNASCSYQAVVTTKSKDKKRNTAIVLAEDLKSGNVSKFHHISNAFIYEILFRFFDVM